MRRRWVILTIVGPLYVVGLALIGTLMIGLFADPPFVSQSLASWLADMGDALSDLDFLVPALTVAIVIAVSQVVFLVPVHRLRPPEGQRSKSLVTSLLIAGVVAAVISTGLLLGIAELAASVLTGRYAASPWPSGGEFLDRWWVSVMVVVTMLASWGFWTAVLLIFSHQLWADRALGRVVGLLVGGTILELIVIIPIDLMVRRRTDCYCATGTFWSLCVATTGVLWLAGPGIYVAATSRRRRLWRREWCGRCGQAKGPSPGAQCPECGYAWDEDAAAGRPREAGTGD